MWVIQNTTKNLKKSNQVSRGKKKISTKPLEITTLSLLSTTLISGLILASSSVSASNSVVDEVSVSIPVSCSLTATVGTAHTATIVNGNYASDIGETTLKAFCNDADGFAIYAIGYTDNLNGKNVLTSTLGSTYDIATGTATSGSTSNWAMKLSTVTNPTPTYPITIQNAFDSYHNVPDDYALVAKRTAGTDIGTSVEGSTLKSTYQAYISPSQPAGTYTGQVKYVLVHPNNNAAPLATSLDIGSAVNIKMKNLAAGITDSTTGTTDDKIKAIRTAESLPEGFVATDANTVSTADSKYPIYIFFDNTNDAGVMYFYTENDSIGMSPDSARLFNNMSSLADISGLSDWDASNLVNFEWAFGRDSSLVSLHGLEDWDTGNLKSLLNTFNRCTSLSDISALADWDTSSVTSLFATFFMDSSLASLDALEAWDTSSVTNAYALFYGNTALSDIDGLANWDTGNIEEMSYIFHSNSHLTDISGLANWDVSNVKALEQAFVATSLGSAASLSEWDVSNVENMASIFANSSLASVQGLEGWDTSNATDMQSMFQGTSITTVAALADWNTSSLTTMRAMFSGSKINSLVGLENWYTGNVENMAGLFSDTKVSDLTPLANWDTSSVIYMSSIFRECNLTSLLPLSEWDVGNVQTFHSAFNTTSSSTLTTLAGLENWDVSGATNMLYMFADSAALIDASAINDWDITNVSATAGDGTETGNLFYQMFRGSPAYPNFSKREGTWNSGGTFIPTI